MIRSIVAIVFTIAVFVFINVVGDLVVRPQTASVSVSTETEEPAEEPATKDTAAAPMPTPAPAPAPVPAPTSVPETPAPQPEPKVADASGAGDAEKGATLFRRKCKACHTSDKGDKNRTGPNLWGVVGRKRASVENFSYSSTMKNMGGVWTESDILSFIAGPRSFVPDTKMVFPGLKSADDRADVLAFLKTLQD